MMQDLLICDTHNDALLHMTDADCGLCNNDRQISHAKLLRARPALMTFAAYVSEAEPCDDQLHMGFTQIDRFLTLMRVQTDSLVQVSTPAQVRAAHSSGKIAALLACEGGGILAGQLYMLRILYALGVRMFSLCWSLANELACGCAQANDTGLTLLGRQAIVQIQSLGMMLDLSHASDNTFWQAVSLAVAPICISHTCARALTPITRNASNEMLRYIAAHNGYVGVAFADTLLLGPAATRRPCLADVVRHVEHIASVCGTHCVGIGSDYDGMDTAPQGLDDVSALPDLANALLSRNWSEQDVRGIMGENFLRYWLRVDAREIAEQ